MYCKRLLRRPRGLPRLVFRAMALPAGPKLNG